MSPIEVFCCLLCVTLLLLIIYFLIRVERVLVQGFEGHVENYEHLVQLIRREVTRNEERRRLRRKSHCSTQNKPSYRAWWTLGLRLMVGFHSTWAFLWLKSAIRIYHPFFRDKLVFLCLEIPYPYKFIVKDPRNTITWDKISKLLIFFHLKVKNERIW